MDEYKTIEELKKVLKITLIISCVGWIFGWWVLIIGLIVSGLLFFMINIYEGKLKKNEIEEAINNNPISWNECSENSQANNPTKQIENNEIDYIKELQTNPNNLTEIQFEKVKRVLLKIQERKNYIAGKKSYFVIAIIQMIYWNVRI